MARFLVVDDDPASARALGQLLQLDGHEVVEHTSHTQAIEALRRRPFDAVVTDLEMPHDEGRAVLRAARDHQPWACLVVATTGDDATHRDLLDSGACLVATKPIAYDDVSRQLHDCHLRRDLNGDTCCPMRAQGHHDRIARLGGR